MLKKAENSFLATLIILTTATNGDRIVQFAYLGIFAGLTITLVSRTIENRYAAQIAQSILTGLNWSNNQTSENSKSAQIGVSQMADVVQMLNIS